MNYADETQLARQARRTKENEEKIWKIISEIQNDIKAIQEGDSRQEYDVSMLIAWKAQQYKVGDIFITINTDNPTERFGGEWELFQPGRTLVCIDTEDTAFNTIEKTGGEKQHTLTIDEMPEHRHNQIYTGHYVTAGTTNIAVDTYGGGMSGVTNAQMSNTGGNGAHNNLQPYAVVYVWKRIA